MAKTFGEIRLHLSKTPVGAGADIVLLSNYINARIQQIIDRSDWQRLIVSSTVQTSALYETGTLTVTNGSTAITGTGTTFTSDMTGRRIRITGRTEYYTFTYVSATSGTLDRSYEGDTDTAATYKIFQNVFSLPSNLDRLENVTNLRNGNDLNQIGREALDRKDPSRNQYGEPYEFAPYDDSSTPLQQIEVFPIPTVSEALAIRYRKRIAEITNTATSLPDWINPAAIYAGVEADLYALRGDYAGAQWKESLFEKAVEAMILQDAIATPAEVIEMADRYTRHRQARIYGDDVDAGDAWRMP